VYVSDTVVLPAMSHALAAATGRQLRLPYLVPSGNGGTATYPLKTMLSLGRMPNNDVVIGDPEVSRSHAVILRREGMTRVRDLNSANGTWVNGRRIEREEPLHNGDTVTLGDSSFIYHDDVEAARPRLVRADDGRREYPLGQGLHLGRLPSNDVVIQDPKASRRHAEVSMRDGQVVLRDLESLNGTRVNGELVFGDRALQDGDTITIGDTALIYHDDLGAGRS
jgi:pSer/pThr/pTyr-binding forkhead associated (FHA) protein